MEYNNLLKLIFTLPDDDFSFPPIDNDCKCAEDSSECKRHCGENYEEN